MSSELLKLKFIFYLWRKNGMTEGLVELLNTAEGTIAFNDAVKLRTIENHWWTKLGRFLRVY